MRTAMALACLALSMLPIAVPPAFTADAPASRIQSIDGTWDIVPLSGGAPPSRFLHTSIYDPIARRMVVFGGTQSEHASSHFNDTWSFEPESRTWTQLLAGFPLGRKSATSIFDPVRHRMLVFGGYSNTYLNDLWALELSGSPGWVQLTPGNPPSPRMFSLAVYDPLRDRMIVFGGHPSYLNDVWALSLSGTPTWTPLTPGGEPPAPRFSPVGVYDPNGDRLVVFGGIGSEGALDDTWELSLGATPTWTRLAAGETAPAPRLNSTAVYDEIEKRMVVFGGSPGYSDVWALDLDGPPVWTVLGPGGNPPGVRRAHVSVYEPIANRMLTYGGWSEADVPQGTTWSLQWNAFANGPPEISSFNPEGGDVGTVVVIRGTDFADATSVTFGGASSSAFAVLSNVEIRAEVPVGAATGPIEVVTPLGTAASATDFIVGPPPEVWSAVPDSAKRGATVTITGQHLAGTTRVSFGGPSSDAAFTVIDDSTLTATVDTAAVTGSITITSPTGTGSSAFTFVVRPPDPEPHLVAVRDVSGDQGGRVVVSWNASELDLPNYRVITGYRVWRRAPPFAPNRERFSASRTLLERVSAAGTIEYWEHMVDMPAGFLAGYAFVAPTLRDSSADGNPYTAFFVQALTADAFTFHDSNVDSGYSVDNLAPPAPEGFVASRVNGGVRLRWRATDLADHRTHFLHRGDREDFAPGQDNLLASVPDTTFFDSAPPAGSVFYKLAAVDVHGNRGVFVVASLDQPVNTLLSLVSVSAEPGRVRIEWQGAVEMGRPVTLFRSTTGGEWSMIAEAIVAHSERVVLEDGDPVSGSSGYRLRAGDGGREWLSEEVWVLVPGPIFAMEPVHPNPADRAVSVAFTLDRTGHVDLQLVDVTGRTVSERALSGAPAGRHAWELRGLERLPAGLYWLRLSHADRTRVQRVAIVH